MLASLGHEVSAAGVARLYEGLVDRYILDETDAELAPAVEAMGMEAMTAPDGDADRCRPGRAWPGSCWRPPAR